MMQLSISLSNLFTLELGMEKNCIKDKRQVYTYMLGPLPSHLSITLTELTLQ